MKKINFLILLSLFTIISCNQEKVATVEHQHEEVLAISLTESQFKNVGITLGKIESKNISATIQVSGILDVPPQNLVSISALMGGFIKSTDLLQGMKVKKGQALATIQNPDFIQIQQDYLENKSKLKFAEQEYKRQEDLAKENIAAQQMVQQAASNYTSLKAIQSGILEKLTMLGISPTNIDQGTITSTVSIRSPINGYVTTLNVNIGKYVNPQDVICEIVNTEHLHVELTVFEKDMHKIKVGQKVNFFLANESKIERKATVYLINKKIDEDRSVRVHAHLDVEQPNLIPGTYLKALVEVSDSSTTVLPDEAIVSAGDKFYIFKKSLKQKNGEFSFDPIEVKKGIAQDGYTEVLLPTNININKTEVVLKGAYDLLAKMNNVEEEHSH